jgi:hypothetical protein
MPDLGQYGHPAVAGDLTARPDGLTEARSPAGEFFGEQRLADFISTALAAGDRAPKTLRRLMRSVLTHQADQLRDDASIVVLEWLTGTSRHFPGPPHLTRLPPRPCGR